MAKLQKIRTKLELSSKRKSLLLLEGEYTSQLKGKSLDFDDLREYVYGDDVRDIDWRASARQSTPLVKRYVAHRRHNVQFVVDTSLPMIATAPDYSPKYDLANTVMGLLGSVILKHNDSVGLVYANTNSGFSRLPYRGDEKHLNKMLDIVEETTLNNPTAAEPAALLQYANLSSNGQTIMVMITGTFTPSEEMKKLIRTIQHRHDLLWVTVADINPISVSKEKKVLDILDIVEIPDVLRGSTKLVQDMGEDNLRRESELSTFLTSLQVSHAQITSLNTIIPTLLTLLKRREHVSRY